MATERPRAYAELDQVLFDATQIPASSRDQRSVGEMLLDVDHLARQLLMDVEGDDAGALLRSWPRMMAAANDLWVSVPRRRPDLDDGDRRIMKLTARAATYEASLAGRTGWPGQGPPDPRFDQMAHTLTSATTLVRRYAAEITPTHSAVHRDLEAARTRIMHVLYLSAHAVNVALHQHGRDRVNDARLARRRIHLAEHHSPYAVAPTGIWIQRMDACENTARTYLKPRFPHALAGEATTVVDDPCRLSQALARYDIESHRALARDPAPATILLITRTQALVAAASMAIIDAATDAGILQPSERLAPSITEAGRSWSNLAARWGDLATPGTRLEPHLVNAAAELRATYRQITHTTTTPADTKVIATHPHLREATVATLHAIEASAELAPVIADKADTPHLAGPARALSRRAHNDIEAGLATPGPADEDIVWVSPADIHARRTVLLPPPVHEALRAASRTTTHAASTAAATASLERTRQGESPHDAVHSHDQPGPPRATQSTPGRFQRDPCSQATTEPPRR